MEHLIPQQADKYKGCELIFPETAFFRAGKPKIIFKYDREYCLITMRNADKLKLNLVTQDFQNIVRERKRDSNGVFA